MTKTIPLILASASPRRKEILEAHGHMPVVIPANVDETLPENSGFSPGETAVYLAGLKTAAVLGSLDPEDWLSGCTILGVDTIVFKERIIGKPVDEADALGILRSLKNASHEVISGVNVIRCGAGLVIISEASFFDTTTVRFGDYSDEEILVYIRANPPYDKSGSYAIQSDWGRHVLEVDGDIENVIGLPYRRIAPYL